MGRSTCVAVIGGHRSGSSCVAGVLHNLGVRMGTDLVGPTPSNPLGHFEDKAFRDIHGEMVGDWRRPEIHTRGHKAAYKRLIRERERQSLWGVKDPRLVLVFPEFRRALKRSTDLRVIRVTRPQYQMIQSLVARAEREPNVPHIQVTQGDAARIATLYERAIGLALDEWPGPVLEVDFGDLVQHPRQVVQSIADFCGVDVTEKAVDLVQPGLKHL